MNFIIHPIRIRSACLRASVAASGLLVGCVSIRQAQLPGKWDKALQRNPAAAGAVAGNYRSDGRMVVSADRTEYPVELYRLFFERTELSDLRPAGIPERDPQTGKKISPPKTNDVSVRLQFPHPGSLEVTVLQHAVVVGRKEYKVTTDASTAAVVLSPQNSAEAKMGEHAPSAHAKTSEIRLRHGSDGCLYVQTASSGVGATMIFVLPVAGVTYSSIWMRFEPTSP